MSELAVHPDCERCPRPVQHGCLACMNCNLRLRTRLATELQELRNTRTQLASSQTQVVMLREALESCADTMCLSSRDWSLNVQDAWLYGILVGWDDEPGDVSSLDAMKEIAAKHCWTPETVARLRRLHNALSSVPPTDRVLVDKDEWERMQQVIVAAAEMSRVLQAGLMSGQDENQALLDLEYALRHREEVKPVASDDQDTPRD